MKNIITSARSTIQDRVVRRKERQGELFSVVPKALISKEETITEMLIESLTARDDVIERLLDMLHSGEPVPRIREELEESVRRINEFEYGRQLDSLNN